jgi:anti-anti-sigma regulatory factor
MLLPAVFDAGAAESLRTEFSDILRRGPSLLRLDFTQVQQVSAAALSLLASFAREIARSEPVIAVVAERVSGPMSVLLRTTGLDRTFKPNQSSSRQNPPRR